MRKRTLGLDIGEKRIGIAISDPLGLTAQGVQVLERKNDMQVIDAIDACLTEYEADTIVVGLPLNLDGTESEQTGRVRRFAEKLQKRFRKRATIKMWDERLSTAGAERSLLEADLSRARRKKLIDKMAATFILQGYLDAQSHEAVELS